MKESGGTPASPPRPAAGGPARATAGDRDRQRHTEETLQQLRASLQAALERAAEQTGAVDRLQAALAAAEQRLGTVEGELAQREHAAAGVLRSEVAALEQWHGLRAGGAGGDAQPLDELVADLTGRGHALAALQERYAAELEATCQARAALAPRLHEDPELRRLSAEQRLRAADSTLAQTLQELEEQRVALVELRMMLEATEHHAAGAEREVGDRAQRAEARLRQLQTLLQQAQQQSEEARITSAELKTMSAAMEYRASQLEAAVAARELELNDLRLTAARDRDDWTATRDALTAELQAVREENDRLLAVQQGLTASQATLQEQLDQERAGATSLGRQAAALQEERRRVVTALEEETARAAHDRAMIETLVGERDAARQQEQVLRESLATQTREASEAHAERDRAQQSWEAERAGLTEQVRSAQEALAHTEAARHGLITERARLEQAFEAQQERLVGLEQRARAAEMERAQVVSTLAETTAELAAERAAHAQASEARDGASARGLDLEQQLATATQELGVLQETVARERGEWAVRLAGFTAESAAAQAERERLTAALAELETTRATLEGNLREADARVATLDREAIQHQEERARLEGNVDRVTTEIATQREMLAQLSGARDAALARVHTLEETLRNRERELSEQRVAHREASGGLRTQLAGLAAELIETKKALQATEEGRGTERTLSEEQRAALARDLAAIQEQLRQQTDQCGQLTEQLQRLEATHGSTLTELRELSTAREASEAQRTATEQRANGLAAELATVRDQHYTAAGENAQLLAEVRGLVDERTSLQQDLQQLQARLAADETKLRELHELHEHSTELYQLVESELQEARAAHAAAVEHAETLSQTLEVRGQDVTTLQAAVERATEERERVLARLQTLEQTEEAQGRELAALRLEREESAAGAAALRERLATLESDQAALRETRAALEQRVEALGDRDALAARVTELEGVVRRAEVLEDKLREGQTERERLQERVESTAGQCDQLQRERDQLRRRAALADEAERHREENAQLKTRLEELDRQQADATQRHSQAVSGYMLELNQRTELLRQRELQLEKLTEELRGVQQAREEATGQLAALRQERELLEVRVRELEAARPARPPAPAVEPPRPAAASPGSLRLASGGAPGSAKVPAGAETTAPAGKTPAASDVAAATAKPRVAGSEGSASGRLTVLHIEDDPVVQEKIRQTVGRFPRARYLVGKDTPAGPPPGPTLLVVNLLARGADPLACLSQVSDAQVPRPRALTYCVEAGRGVHLGVTDVFPHPFDLDACAKRLSERPGGLQRLLVVGETVELLNEMRSALAQMRCSISVALDARQAYDLVEMVKPQVVLVDLGLPRGEGLRLSARLRSDPNQAATPLALMWARSLDAAEFRTQTLRVIRDYLFRPDDLARSVQAAIGEAGYGAEALRDAG